jgi:hypothetical protein
MAYHSPGYWVGYGFGILVVIGVYLSPTIVAVAIKSRNLLPVLLIDVVLGWTVIGWIIAWVLCFVGGRQDPRPGSWPTQQPGAYGLSPDGMFWWDGIAWRDTRVVAPPWAQRSPDGYWWWDGARWRPMPPPPPPQG